MARPGHHGRCRGEIVLHRPLGWETEDNDAGGAVYTTCRIGGDAVSGLFEMSDDRRARGVRIHGHFEEASATFAGLMQAAGLVDDHLAGCEFRGSD